MAVEGSDTLIYNPIDTILLQANRSSCILQSDQTKHQLKEMAKEVICLSSAAVQQRTQEFWRKPSYQKVIMYNLIA